MAVPRQEDGIREHLGCQLEELKKADSAADYSYCGSWLVKHGGNGYRKILPVRGRVEEIYFTSQINSALEMSSR